MTALKKLILFVLLVFQIAYKSDDTHDDVDYNYPATLTPSYQTTRKLVPLKDVNNPLSSHPTNLKGSPSSVGGSMIQGQPFHCGDKYSR